MPLLFHREYFFILHYLIFKLLNLSQLNKPRLACTFIAYWYMVHFYIEHRLPVYEYKHQDNHRGNRQFNRATNKVYVIDRIEEYRFNRSQNIYIN